MGEGLCKARYMLVYVPCIEGRCGVQQNKNSEYWEWLSAAVLVDFEFALANPQQKHSKIRAKLQQKHNKNKSTSECRQPCH